MLDLHRRQLHGDHYSHREQYTMLGTEATRQQSHNYGCIVRDKVTQEVSLFTLLEHFLPILKSQDDILTS